MALPHWLSKRIRPSGTSLSPRWGLLLLVPLALAFQRRPLPVQQANKGDAVFTIRHQVSLAETRPVSFTPKPLVNAAAPERPPATTNSQWYTHRYAGPLQNGRLSAPLGTAAWKIRWTANVPAIPTSVLRISDRILLQASGWILLTLEGKTISQGSSGSVAISADPSAGLFYSVTPANYLEARSLTNGELEFQSPLLVGAAFSWPLIVRLQTRILLAGVEQPLGSHAPRPGTRSEIDMMEVESPLRVDVYKQILSLKRSEILHFGRANMLFAAGNDNIFAVAPDYLVFARSGLEVDSVYQAEFRPLFISVDETGNVHLIVEAGGRRALWVVTPEGKRVIQATLAVEHQSVGLPPVIAHNHQIYVFSGSIVVAYSSAGAVRWQHPLAGTIVGASVTADDKLLVAAGSELTVLDSDGKPIGGHRFEGERLTTAPVLTRKGNASELLIATESHVHSLVP